ncbi:MAG: M43 family zinc metalloprotease [Chitinophagales bacterium]
MLKKSLLVPVLTLCLGGAIMAQAPNRDCGTMEVDARLRADDAGYSLNREAIEQFTQNYIATHAGAGERTVVTIPVVVHVVYNTAAENIADSYVYSQIDVLNEDFRRLNADAALTPAAFAGVAADCEVEFCLANTDPSGNPTTGITRTSTTKTSFNTSDQMKYDTYGHAAWDRNSYLNLWVCDLSSGLLGYAQFPGGPAATDGVVIDYKYFGVGGAGAAPYDLGRTATHEVGHWLNLYHIWGDDGTGCGGSDLVADTPNQADETYGCPLPTIRISCSNGPNGDMYVNYMDYTDDACMNMFTAGQKSRMQALFSPGGSRYSILSSMGCSGGGGATCDTPSGLSTSGITTSTATFNWSSVGAAASYNVRYRTTGGGSWINVSTGSTSYNANRPGKRNRI